MASLNQNLIYLFALPAEQLISGKSAEFTKNSWQSVLAEARTKFIHDLIAENNLPDSPNGQILEMDNGVSKLETALGKSGLSSRTVSVQTLLSEEGHKKFSLGVSHNQLEHLEGIEKVNAVVEKMANQSRFGMIHQVHAVDDPAFEWDKTHLIRMTTNDWEQFFRTWALEHQNEGWTYLGNHRGAPGRPKNHMLERNGSLPFYKDYDKRLMRQLINELTLANGISMSRIPLLLLSFTIAKDDPYLLSGLVGAINALDALDGYVARKGFGNSRQGPLVDIAADHFVELYTAFKYAYDLGYIPPIVPLILTARNFSVDFLRLYNGVVGNSREDAHPHESFESVGKEGRQLRKMYGVMKALGDMTVPIIPRLGLTISTIHVTASIGRAIPVWTSPRAKEITKELVGKIKKNSL